MYSQKTLVLSGIYLFFQGMVTIYGVRIAQMNEETPDIYNNRHIRMIISACRPLRLVLFIYMLVYEFRLVFYLFPIGWILSKHILMPLVEKCFIIPFAKIFMKE